MQPTKNDFEDPKTSASFGGPGWLGRKLSHGQELTAGNFWSPCGVSEEWAPLKSVLLTWPPDSLDFEDTNNLDATLLLRKVNLSAIRSQTEILRSFYEERGIQVFLYQPRIPAPPNLIFMRDAFFMTPEGAIVGRMGGQARAGEERFIADALASNGIPMVGSIRGTGCFEGADALWLSEKKVIIAGGFRTNAEGIRQASALLSDMGIQTRIVSLPRGTQHLLGVFNLVNRDKAVVRAELCTKEIEQALKDNEISIVSLSSTQEVIHQRAMNFVTLKPNCVLMPGGCPETRKIYESHAIECFELGVSEYLNAGGATACLTGVVERSFHERSQAK